MTLTVENMHVAKRRSVSHRKVKSFMNCSSYYYSINNFGEAHSVRSRKQATSASVNVM